VKIQALGESEVGLGVDESIVALAARMDAWWDGFSPMLYSEDRVAQGNALLKGFEIVREFDHIKAEGLAAITALMTRHDSMTSDERVASLIQGFAFAAKLAAVLHDEFSDVDCGAKIAHLMQGIVHALDAIGSGRAVLAVLLDNSEPSVRASTGAYLIKLMPERVIPILHDIEQNEHANSAHFTAYWTLLRWEREGKGAAIQ
jgi:hypothetical protein